MISLSVKNILSVSNNSAQLSISAFNGKYLAFKLKSNKDIGIWFLKNQPVTLHAHHFPIQALSFCHPHQGELLCSCSDDNIILWDLSQYFVNEKDYRGHILYSGLSGICSCCFSFHDLKIAICSKKNIYVLDIKTKQFLVTLNDTSFPIDCCFIYFNTLFSISENGICKIWKMQEQASAYHKCVTGALPIILTISYEHHRIAIGTASGNIEIYQYDIENNLQHLSSLKVWKLMYDVNKKRENFDVNTQDNEESSYILDMKFITKSSNLDSERLWIENEPPYLIIVITTGIFIINTGNESISHYNFTEFNSSNQEFILPSIIRSADISYSDEEMMTMILIPLLENKFYKLTIDIHFSKTCNKISTQMDNLNLEENIININNVDFLSFLSRESVSPESLLMKEMKTKKQIKPDKSSKMFQPLTFKSNIKSSGYNKSSRRELFQPILNKRNNDGDFLSKRKCNNKLTWENKEYTKSHWEKKPKLLLSEKLSENSKNLILQITGDDKIAALGYSDGLIQLLKISQLKILSSLFYHNKNLSSVHFSHSDMGELLLTSGYDKKVLIWKWKQYQKPLLILDSIKFERKSKNISIPEEITAAQFYYMDKFILLTYGNSLNMFLYNIDTSKSDIESYKMKSCYQSVIAITSDSKRITALSAINRFYSNLVLCGTSSNAINVFDMNTGQCIRCITDVHNKPVYKIALNQGSPYVNQPSPMYDIYATASLSDGIKLWDLRTNQCIRYLKEHPNRYYPCDINFSSCGQYLLSGAEDKCLYTYELRTSRIVQKITGFTDIVSNASFLTSKSNILATTVDGKAYLYGYDMSS